MEYKVKSDRKYKPNMEGKIVSDLYQKKKYVILKNVQLIVLLIIGLNGILCSKQCNTGVKSKVRTEKAAQFGG